MPTHSPVRAKPGVALTARSRQPRRSFVVAVFDWSSWLLWDVMLTGTFKTVLKLWEERRNIKRWTEFEWVECLYLFGLLAGFFFALKHWLDTGDSHYFLWAALGYFVGPAAITVISLLALFILFLFSGAWKEESSRVEDC
ncbi:MAG: hypothetical protein ACM3TU_02065 [Bacillota bacterium]